MELKLESCRADAEVCMKVCAATLSAEHISSYPQTCVVSFAADAANVAIRYVPYTPCTGAPL